MSFTQTITGAWHVEIDGEAHTLTASDGFAGALPRFSDLGIGALALPGSLGRLARTYGLTAEEIVAESNGRITYSAVPVSRIVVASALLTRSRTPLRHAAAPARSPRARQRA